ncbi:MAG: DUF1501 domain-containing protein [Singulisphaera sp.]
MGEFGRTPKINPNAGRDHHSRANSILMAGAGMPGGLVVGRTDARGESPADRPVTPADLAATLYTALGIDPTTSSRRPTVGPCAGRERPRAPVNVEREDSALFRPQGEDHLVHRVS